MMLCHQLQLTILSQTTYYAPTTSYKLKNTQEITINTHFYLKYSSGQGSDRHPATAD
jgi:hypothetical protein